MDKYRLTSGALKVSTQKGAQTEASVLKENRTKWRNQSKYPPFLSLHGVEFQCETGENLRKVSHLFSQQDFSLQWKRLTEYYAKVMKMAPMNPDSKEKSLIKG